MPDPKSPALAQASLADVGRDLMRRIEDRLDALPDGARWTRMDWIFAAIVAGLALSSTGFFTATYGIARSDPDYFFQRLVASFQTAGVDPIETGAVTAASASEGEGVLPVPVISRARDLQPADYEIVMIFADEVLLATARELMRARVGTVLPGLGRMMEIEGTNTVRFEKATLTALAP